MKTRYIAIPIVMVVMLAAFSVPAMAGTNCTCDVSTHGTNPAGGLCSFGTNGTVDGTVYVDDGEGELGLDYVQVDFEAIPAGVNITWARVYWHIWMPGDWTDAKFCNATQCSENNQTICDPSESCTCEQDEYDGFYGGGCGTTWVYWNVTNNVTSGEQHNITIDNRAPGADGRTMWVVLVVVLENSTKYSEIHYWVNQGYEDIEKGDKSTTWFNGTISNETNSTLWHLALCSDVTVGGIWFNDHHVRNDIGDLTKEEINKSWIEVDDETQNMTWDNGDDDWFHPVMAILMDNVTQPEPGKDLTVTDIEFPTVMRPNKNHTINATVKNQGDANTSWFNVSLYVDNLENGTVNVTSLNASESKTVSFENVSLSENCYTFKVVADSGGRITETNEDNNVTSEKYQVGYVIVVESDSDFEKLNETGNAALPTNCFKNESGTYYIQNLTITNCVGDGIYIVDTSKNFVINNCTIENCKPSASGVFLNNITKGTINGSTLQNNTAYGVELGLVPLSDEDPKFINITNNTITENKLNGIDLIGVNCTVKDNNVTNNSVYGIYLFANHSNITNNNITNNDDYGVKLYNSSGNYVYENNFTDNKASNPGYQAWDNGATNNNHWNTTEKGNWWSDWKHNSGYFDSPRVYKIDGDSNKDEKPEGPPGENYTYDFNTGAGEKAYGRQVADSTPGTNGDPNSEFADYTNIKTDDGNYVENIADTDNYAAHRFNFSISEDQDNIIKINVTWNGIGIRPNNFHGAKLYIWNFTLGDYGDSLDSNSDANEVNLTAEKTGTCCSDYIDSSNNMTVLVVQNRYSGKQDSQKSEIKTDYVSVIITT